MAESDPKKLRPAELPDRRSFDADEDPLVELARIVSEDSGFYGGRSEKPKAQARQVQPRRDEPSDRNAISADLEAELLQELESSFASQRSAPPSRSRSTARPATPPPMDDADDLLRSIEEQLGEFERRARSMHEESPDAQAMDERASDDQADVRADRRPGNGAEEAWIAPAPPEHTEEPRTPAPAPIAANWAVRPAALPRGREQPRVARNGPARRGEPAAEEHVRPPVLRRHEETPDRRAVPPRERADQRRSGEAPRPDRAAMHTALEDDVARTNGAAQPGTGWDSIVGDESDDVAATFGRAAETALHPPPAEAMPDLEADLARGIAPARTDPDFDGRWGSAGEAAGLPREPQVAAAMIPPPRPRPAARQRRSGRGLAAAAGVLGVVALGAAFAAYLRSDSEVASGPPPTIAAEQSAVKVEAPPSPEATEGETVGDAVYERVAGDAPEAEEQVVESSEEPREVARIVLPPSQEDAADPLARPVGEQEAASTAAADEVALSGPRRVRTYVVRPDGTIVEGAEPAAAPPPEEAIVVPAGGEPIAPVAVATTEIDVAGDPQTVSAVPTAPSAPEPAESRDPVVEAAPVPDVPPAAEIAEEPIRPSVVETPAVPAPAAPAAESATAAAPEPAAASEPPAAPEPPVEVAAAPVAAEVQPAPAASVAGGFLVQLSSQRSQDAAQSSFADMQRRFPSILGDARPVIQQADLGDQGIYYRVRVGPWATRSEAITVCERLQSAGGDCFVTQ